jgi:hypothetical protein
MILKKCHLIALLLFPAFLAASQPLIPSTIKAELMLKSDPNPSKLELDIRIPELAYFAGSIEKAADATKVASQNVAAMPQSATICALLTLGGICATMCVYHGIQKLETSKSTGLGLITGGILAFIALYFAATSSRSFPAYSLT